MTFNKQDLEDAFDDLGWYDLLSDKPLSEKKVERSVSLNILSIEKALELVKPEHYSQDYIELAYQATARVILRDIVINLIKNGPTWKKTLFVSDASSIFVKVAKFVDLVYQGQVNTMDVLLCSSDLFSFIKLHPKATAGVQNTFHIFGNRIIQASLKRPDMTAIRVTKKLIHLKDSTLPQIDYEVLAPDEITFFAIEGPL
jgi:hypothetical protein